MADIYLANKNINSADPFGGFFWTSKCMLKAGWLLKASSNATTKSTSAEPGNCQWVGPVTLSSQTGSAGAIGAKTGKDFLFTGLTGLVTATKTNQGGSEGNLLYVTGAANAGNNTTWLISKVISATSCYARPLVPTSATATATGTTPPSVTLTGHLLNTRSFNLSITTSVTGALGTGQVAISINGGTNFAAAVVVPSTGVLEIIGADGIHTGVYATFSGSLINLNNAWTSPVATASDANAITWTEKSWLNTTYTSNTTIPNSSWILLEGPKTLKIPFTVAPVGTFFRGENVVQSTTLAEGEVLGVTYEPSTGAGYLVIQPRLQGSGTGVEGWQSSFTITGAKSSATVAQNGTAIRYVREAMYMKSTTNYGGTIYYQCVDDSAEAAQRLSFLSLATGATAVIPPGGGGTNNAFPSICTAVCGTGGSIVHLPTVWNGCSSITTTINNTQVFSANNIEFAASGQTSASADGSYINLMGQTSLSTQSTGFTPFLMRTENGEEGDVEPYVFQCGLNGTTKTRTANTVNSTASTAPDALFTTTGVPAFLSWRKRGFASGDSFIDCCSALFFASSNVGTYLRGNSAGLTDPEKVACSAQTNAPVVLDPILMVNTTATTKTRKGFLRWIFCGDGNLAYDTYGSKTWLQISAFVAGSPSTTAWFMPWDGSTVPVQ